VRGVGAMLQGALHDRRRSHGFQPVSLAAFLFAAAEFSGGQARSNSGSAVYHRMPVISLIYIRILVRQSFGLISHTRYMLQYAVRNYHDWLLC